MPPARRRLRAEIQALRALAVALVVVYHLQPAAVPGGFVGVDVFFVISGFLISRHLLSEAAATGRVDLVAFWAGRVHRILPAALLTTAVVVAAAMLILPRTGAAEVGRASIWAALSAANWLFAADAVDYLAQSADASPFEHFWSLGVEEQFYLLWPLVVLAVAAAARRGSRDVRRRVLLPFGVILLGSLAFGIWFTATGSEAAYFVTPTRMWELAAGGLLAALLAERQPPAVVAATLQLAGVGAVLAAAMLFDPRTPMPGTAALVPVLGAVAIIAAGDAPGLRRLWALRPVRFLGDTSYSLYLWHWPLIVFTRALTGAPLGPVSGAIVVVGSLALAAASYRLVEQPLRRAGTRRPLRTLAIGAAAVVLVLGVGVVPVARSALLDAQLTAKGRSVLAQTDGAPLGWAQLDAAADRTWARSPHVVVPAPETLAHDLSFKECATTATSTTSPVCVVGDRTSRTTVALVGDSHIRQWAPVIDRLGKERHWRVVTVLHNSCPFNLKPRPLEAEGRSRCTEAVRWALPVLRAQRVQVVLTSAYRKSYPAEDRESAAAAYASMWRTLQQDGIRVVALGDTPTPPVDPTVSDCVVARDPATCGSPRSEAEAVPDPLRLAAALADDVPFVDPVDAFCGTTWCPGVIGNVGVYVDDNHASRTYVLSAMPWVRLGIAPIIEQQLDGTSP